ncbi:hypothetical protein LOTGIDRAFT_158760 [Lottia gigantea]|uniref:LRRCT domain-containing protein n=1 Tax=Lottia gigantea TaxID=225164 RepID=V4CAH8_LOTGI|nr:hypothetical protein LOTGIDRAFT_158760 [Lottia gigantea]ESO98809.1 hypothetical protein LOTGIDRAFT_158760 [Lottia gigantea]
MVSFIAVVRSLCIFLVILTLVLAVTPPNVIQCPHLCGCPSKTLVICEGKVDKLTYIPRIPATTRKLVFRGNLVPEIYRDTFKNITFQSGNRVEILDLSNNGIVFISTMAFSKLTYLKELDLSKNYLRDPDGLQKALVGLRFIHVHRLMLHHMDLGDDSIPSNLFEPLTYLNSIQTIDMSDNVLNEFDFQTLVNLTSLEELILSSNRISGLTDKSFDGMNLIKTIDLSSSNFQDFVTFSEDIMSTLLPKTLEILSLRNSILGNVPRFNSSNITELDLSENKITKLHLEDIANYPSLRVLNLNSNRLTRISEGTIPPSIQDQLIAVGFADNPLLCSCDIAWLHNWMVKEPLKFLTMGTQIECLSEETGSFILLEDYKPTNCGSISHVTLTITIACCVIVVIIIAVLIFCYRKRIKLFCYVCTRKRGGEQLVLSDNVGI